MQYFFTEPPTYEEATQFERNEENEQNFNPKYAMFKHTTSYSNVN